MGTILSSTDGTTWSQESSGTQATLDSIAFGNNRFVAVGGGIAGYGIVVYSTSSGWQSKDLDRSYKDITFGNNSFVAVSGSSIAASPNGEDWQILQDTPLPLFYSGIAIAYGNNANNTFVVVGEDGSVRTSTDGTIWNPRVRGSGDILYIKDVAFGNSRFVAVGDALLGLGDSVVYISSDAQKWTRHTLSDTLSDVSFNSITFANGFFVAVDAEYQGSTPSGIIYAGVIYTSTDGLSWNRRHTESGVALRDITFGNGRFVAVGSGDKVLVSQNGTSWNAVSLGQNEDLESVTFGNNKYVAVGRNGAIYISNDADTWTKVNSGTTNTLVSVAFGNNLFVAVGVGRTILTSTDGTTWELQTNTGIMGELRAVAFGNGMFVAVDNKGTIYTSNDGKRWTIRERVDIPLIGIAYVNNIVVAVGDFGTIITSP